MKVAVVGGGIGGLMSALFLAKQGIEVTIYEKEARLGGRLAFVEKEGFRIDQGPTIVLLPDMFRDLLAEAGIDERSYELLLCDPLYSIQFADGVRYTKYRDMDRQLEELKRVFPNEMDGFRRFIEDGRIRFSIGKRAFLEKAFSEPKQFWTLQNLRALLKLKPYQSVKRLMSTYFRDERLQTAYSLQTLYIGGNPFHAPAMYSLIPFSEHEHGVWYLKGGYASLVPLLEHELHRRGVAVRRRCEVTKIHTDGHRVVGIATAEGTKRYDAVIFNGDFPTIYKLIGEQAPRSFVPSSGCVLFYFGLNRVYREENVHQFFVGEPFSEHMKAVFERKTIPYNPAFYTFHPSIIDDSLAPAGKGVLYVLVPVPADADIEWAKETEWLAHMVERIEQLAFPGLKNAMEWMEVQTPNDAHAFGLYRGGSFGIAPTLFQSGIFRPQVKLHPFENLYAVGASVHPGGGIPIVMQGAKLLANQLLHDYTHRGVSVHA